MPDLGAAAALLESLGFSATPVSDHEVAGKPAGTANRWLIFRRRYIEILAPTLDTPNAQRVRERMARYGGVHLVCFGTPDAQAERARLAAHGFDPEPLVRLHARFADLGDHEANVIDASGSPQEVAAALLSAFAAGRLVSRSR